MSLGFKFEKVYYNNGFITIMVVTIKVESTIIVIKLPVKQKQNNRSLIFAIFLFQSCYFLKFRENIEFLTFKTEL